MKRITCLVFLAILAIYTASAKQNEVALTGKPTIPKPKKFSIQRSQSEIIHPVAAFVDENMLSVYFQAAVGNATISITDSYGTVVEQITVDTYQQTEIDIPTCFWDADEYTISISYNSTTLSGVFQLE